MTLEGQKVLLGLQLGSRESYEDWLDFARDLTRRGLRCPALVVADGAPGLWKAVAEAWPAALAQRCTVHKLRNLLAKLPERLHREVKGRYWAAFEERTPAAAKRRLAALAADYRAAYPSFARCLEEDLDALVCHLRFPYEHRRRTRSTKPARAHVRRGQTQNEDDRPLPRRDLCAQPLRGLAWVRVPCAYEFASRGRTL